MSRPPSTARVSRYHVKRIPYRSCSISSSVSSIILRRRRNTATITSYKALQVLTTMVIVTILLLQDTTTTLSTTFAFSFLHSTNNRKNPISPFHLPVPTTTARSFTAKMALGGINEEKQQRQQQQQNATSFAPDRPFIPYLRDIERVLNNHAMIRQNSLQQQQQQMGSTPNNNNNHNGVGPNSGNGAILFHEQQRLQQQQETGSNQNMLTFYSWCNEQRRNKPSLLLYDMDGAEKCIQMIRHLQQQHPSSSSSKMFIPDAAYIQIMKVILQRGRLRWKRSNTYTHDSQNNGNNSVIICAADQLEELLLEYESQSLPPHSTKDTNPPAIGTTATNFNIELYNLVLEAYAICATPRGDRQYAQRAQSLLQRMEKKMESFTDSSNQQPHWLPVESYLHVLHAFAWQQGNLQSPVDGADEAYALLQIVKERTDDIRTIMQATIWVLEAYSKSLNGAVQCNSLLQKVKEYNTTLTQQSNDSGTDNDGTSNINSSTVGRQLFDAEVYSNAILAWSKAADAKAVTTNDIAPRGSSLSEDDDNIIISIDTSIPATNTATPHDEFIEQAAKNAHDLLLELVDHYLNGSFMYGSEPPLIAFNGVISAYSRLGHIDLAEDVLWLMEREVRPKCMHLIPNAISYNSILHGIYRQSQEQPQHSQQHLSNRINTKYSALQKALSIVSFMEENSIEQPAIRPNAFSYQTIMKCWLQCSNSNNNMNSNYSKEYITEQAEQLLYKVEQLWGQGDTSFEYTNRIYNMLLNAYAKTYNGKRFLSNKAMDLLSRMKQSTHSMCQPDIISYTSTLECIAQSSDPTASELADELLQEVKMRYATTNDVQLRPNLRTFTMTIQTLARNNGNIVRARELLTELVEEYERSGYDPQLKPNTYPYNYVLNCAANTMDPDQRLHAFQVATQTYQEMRQSKILHPDSFSYAFWLKCCNNLLDRGPLRTKAMMYAFEECKRDGLVSSEVLTRLLQGCPKDVVANLLELRPPPPPLLSDATSNEDITVIPRSQQYTTYSDDNNNFFQQRRNSIKSPAVTGSRAVSSPTSSFRSRDGFMTNTNTDSNNNNYRYNNLTVRDLPPSWSRNAIRTKKG